MSDVFNEVEESLRTEKAQKAWSRAAPFVYGVSALIVLAVGGREIMSYQRQSAIDAAALSFETARAATQTGDSATAKTALTETSLGGGGFGVLAAHQLADLELGVNADASAAAETLISAADGAGPLEDLARLKAAYLQADGQTLDALEGDLQPLLDQGGAFGALARELIAAKAYEAGDYVRARREYSVLTLDLDVPPGVQSRANLALAVIPVAETPIDAPDASETTGVGDDSAVSAETPEDDPS
ncbi:MAG: hypothetical protein AAF719_12470 [Pseudomonadota bacterium]